jgi:hypothetical protein
MSVATPSDLEALLASLDAIAAWLHSIVVKHQWPASFPATAAGLRPSFRFIEATAIITP